LGGLGGGGGGVVPPPPPPLGTPLAMTAHCDWKWQ